MFLIILLSMTLTELSEKRGLLVLGKGGRSLSILRPEIIASRCKKDNTLKNLISTACLPMSKNYNSAYSA